MPAPLRCRRHAEKAAFGERLELLGIIPEDFVFLPSDGAGLFKLRVEEGRDYLRGEKG